MDYVIECKDITHFYGDKKVHENLNFACEFGKVTGLLGKNGTGKSTIINILMGFLKPNSGECRIFGELSTKLSPQIRAKIGLLYEGHVSYDFLSISQIEKLYKAHYKGRWQKDRYYDLVAKLGVNYDQKLCKLSNGQRSQVVLGLIFASDPDLLILDDYAIGLDAGYRSLFVEYLHDFVRNNQKSVLMTTHIMADLENLIDNVVILRKDKEPYINSLSEFRASFQGIETRSDFDETSLNGEVTSVVNLKDRKRIYGFFEIPKDQKELNLSFEDTFLGLTGRY